MESNLKYSLFALFFMTLALIMNSCSDWTIPESLDLKNPSLGERNPQLYADYIKDLNKYKAGEHKITVVSFENSKESPTGQQERLTTIPDSIDFICLNNPNNISYETQDEMIEIRKKGTRTVYIMSYENFEKDWKEMVKENPTLTEEQELVYLDKCTDDMLALCDKYNYDGIMVDYTGRSLVSLKEEDLMRYNKRQQTFFNKVMSWREKHGDKTLMFYGNVQYLVPGNMSMLKKYNYIVLKSALSTNGDDLTVKSLLALQAGEDVKNALYEGVNPVPADRFMACVELPQADDQTFTKGYWNTVDASGNKITASRGAAQWMVQSSPDFTRSGIFIMNVQNDYYNNTYGYLREAICIMNPNK